MRALLYSVLSLVQSYARIILDYFGALKMRVIIESHRQHDQSPVCNLLRTEINDTASTHFQFFYHTMKVKILSLKNYRPSAPDPCGEMDQYIVQYVFYS